VMDFVPSSVRTVRRRPTAVASTTFSKRFVHPVVHSLKAAPTTIDFSPTSPHDLCVASSLQVDIFSLRTNSVYRTLTRFKDVVCCAAYRHDGKVLAAADEVGTAQIFDLGSRAVMRTFKGHTGAAHAIRFSADGSRLFTGGDDAKVNVWDIGGEEKLYTAEGHTDFVRTVRGSEASPHVVISGSYDHTVKLWDVSAGRLIMTLQHADPVEDVALLRGGGVLAVANGNRITFCDLLSGGRVLHTVSAHSKTITSLYADSAHLLSASLDHQLKFYDLGSYKVNGSLKYAAPLLAASLSPNLSHLVVGMSDNTLCIRRQRAASARADTASASSPADAYSFRPAGGKPGQVAAQSSISDQFEGAHPGTYRYFLRGRTHAPQTDDLVTERGAPHRLSGFDKALKTFKYHEALDAALLDGGAEVVVGVIEELVQRNGLRIALNGRDQQSLQPLISFLVRQITKPPFATVLVGVANLLLDMYAPVLGQSAAIDELFVKLRSTLEAEVALQVDLAQLMGAMDVLLAGAMRVGTPATVARDEVGAAASLHRPPAKVQKKEGAGASVPGE